MKHTGSTKPPCKEYVCDYYHDGTRWALNITAYDWKDAEARVKKLGNLKLRGELMMTIPASEPSGWFVKAYCWFRNLFSTP